MEHFTNDYWAPVNKAYETSNYLADLRPPAGMIEAPNGDWVCDPEWEMSDSNDTSQEDIA
jgi:hypothetical protein